LTQPERTPFETILVVEDHPVVLEAVRMILARVGFNVLTASNKAEAIRLEKATVGPIHLLLSDVMMPDTSGPAIAQLLKEHRPEMRVMLMSGYPGGDMLFLNYGWHFIEKPFLPAQLVARVNDLLHTAERSQGDAHFDTRNEPKE
jgi:two-component system, cell cycle sensor histidine kinase and response regulator CckA